MFVLCHLLSQNTHHNRMISAVNTWERIKRSAWARLRSQDTMLHLGLAAVLLGGLVVADTLHQQLWQAHNKGVSYAGGW
jgi:hypothetical protein